MDELDEDFEKFLTTIEEYKNDFPEDEQLLINSWIAKLHDEPEDDNQRLIRNEYAYFLQKMLKEPDNGLDFPFNEPPPDTTLGRLSDFNTKKRSLSWEDGSKRGSEQSERTSLNESISKRGSQVSERQSLNESGSKRSSQRGSQISERKPRCCANYQAQGGKLSIPEERRKSPQRTDNVFLNEFESQEEMAKIIARSKGQSIIEFVAAISPHTVDRGVKLRNALKVESSSFKDYVNRIVSQRIQDLTDILAKEQKAEIERIRDQIDKWQLESVHIRNIVQEMLPEFDFDSYEQDKDYLRKFFVMGNLQKHQQNPSISLTEDDDLTEWKEEACHHLRWFHEEACKLEQENDEIRRQLEKTRSQLLILESGFALEEQTHLECMQKLNAEIEALKSEYCQMKSEAENRGPSPDGSQEFFRRTSSPIRSPSRSPSRSPCRSPSRNY